MQSQVVTHGLAICHSQENAENALRFPLNFVNVMSNVILSFCYVIHQVFSYKLARVSNFSHSNLIKCPLHYISTLQTTVTFMVWSVYILSGHVMSCMRLSLSSTIF